METLGLNWFLRPLHVTDLHQLPDLLETMPEAFTTAGRDMLVADAADHRAIVAVIGDRLIGVVVWVAMAYEIEVLWLAVATEARNGRVARDLIESVERTVTTQKILIAKTADPECLPPDTTMTVRSARRIGCFLQNMGFRSIARIPDYWGSRNPAIVYLKEVLPTHGPNDAQ